MNKYIEKIIRLLTPLYRSLGVNMEQLILLVSTKITVGDRIAENNKSGGRKSFKKQLLFSSLLTPLMFLILLINNQLSVAILIYASLIMILTIMTYMTEYPYLYFNKTENELIERFPVSSVTLMASRLTSMIGYIAVLVLSMCVLPMIMIAVVSTIGTALMFLVGMFFLGCFSLFLANLFYLLIIRLVAPAKFEKIAAYIQIVLMVAVMMSYQVIGRDTVFESFSLAEGASWWLWLIPSVWFSAIPMVMIESSSQLLFLILTGLVATGVLLLLNVRVTSGDLMQRTSGITHVGTHILRKDSAVMLVLARLFTRKGQERGGFILTWKLTATNLKFKQTILPMFLYVVMMDVFMLYNELFRNNSGAKGEDIRVFFLLAPLYFAGWAVLLAYDALTITDKEHISEIYISRPLITPGKYLLGCFKAVFLKYFIPFIIVLTIPSLYWKGVSFLPSVLFCLLLLLFYGLVYFRYTNFAFPFSIYTPQGLKGEYTVKGLINILIIGVLCTLQFLITMLPYGSFIGIALMIPAILWITARIRQVSPAVLRL